MNIYKQYQKKFPHEQRNFRWDQPNQFYSTPQIVSAMRSKIIGGYFSQINCRCSMIFSLMRSELFGGINQINFPVLLKLFRLCAAKFSVGSVKLI